MKEKARIEKVYTRQEKSTVPTLLKFQNGNIATIGKESTQFCHVTQKENNSKNALVVANDQVYVGPIDGTGYENLTDTYICVRNKTTNKVRIIPIEEAHLINTVYKKLDKVHLAVNNTENTTQKLLKEFGGRKASRYVTNQEKMKVNIDVLQSELETTVQEADLNNDSVQQLDSEAHLDFIRPKFNKDATKLEDIYQINDVVPTELLARLEEESKAVFSTPAEKLPITSEYLQKCIKNIQSTTQSTEGFQKIKMIIYMDSLLKLLTSRVRILKNVELSGITEKVENDVRTRFSDPNSKNLMRTSQTTHKALCYFIVLALLISDKFEVDLNTMVTELRTPRAKLIKFAHIVNARRKGQTDILALQLPSTVSKLPSQFSRRSKK